MAVFVGFGIRPADNPADRKSFLILRAQRSTYNREGMFFRRIDPTICDDCNERHPLVPEVASRL